MEDANEWINTVLSRAAELRAKGVLSIGFDGKSATFAPAEPPQAPPDTKDSTTRVDEPVDPFHQPESYPDGVVPGFQIEKFDRED